MALTLKEIIGKCDMLPVYKERRITDEYIEIVFYSKDIVRWNDIFVDVLGSPIKPKGVNPTEGDLNLAKDCGGISGEQTLFKREYDGAIVMAMFWPWQDGVCTTLKMTFLDKKKPA